MNIPRWIAEWVVEEATFEYGGVVYPLLLVDPAFMPTIRNFVGFPPPDRNFLFIANNVPKKYWLPMLGHEVYEFTELDGQLGRCSAAAELELGHVAVEDLDEYLAMRVEMFTDLIAYAEKQGQTNLAEEAAGSLVFFQSFQSTRWRADVRGATSPAQLRRALP